MINFLIVTHAEHKYNKQGQLGGYAPYVREMNIWAKHVDTITIIAPLLESDYDNLDIPYQHPNIKFVRIPLTNVSSVKNILYSLICIPYILFVIIREMRKSNHIHLRCPGNIGLLGSIAQIFFPRKKKTAKYAGNWDPESNQPKSYRIQQKILTSTFLTKNMKVLVYGNSWPNVSKNILPFFTATYSNNQREYIAPRPLNKLLHIRLIYVGALSTGKQPLLSVKAAEMLTRKGYKIQLDMFGEGPERTSLENYIRNNALGHYITLHGNQSAETVRGYFKQAHFLIFISKSEGWPKVVAESMFWGCVPITTKVSCVPDMVDNGTRGTLVVDTPEAVNDAVEKYLHQPDLYVKASENGQKWSQQFTLEKFDEEVKKLV